MAKHFRLPRKIVVKGVEYTIRQKKELSYKGKEVYGLHDHIRNVISVNSSIKKPKDRRVTMIHELFHAYLHQCGICEGIDEQLEEVIVDVLAVAMEHHFEISWKN